MLTHWLRPSRIRGSQIPTWDVLCNMPTASLSTKRDPASAAITRILFSFSIIVLCNRPLHVTSAPTTPRCFDASFRQPSVELGLWLHKPRRARRSLTPTSLTELAPSPAAAQGRLYLSWPVVAMATHPHVVHAGWKSAALHPPGSPRWCEKCLAVKRQRAANASRESQEEEMDYRASFPPTSCLWGPFGSGAKHRALAASVICETSGSILSCAFHAVRRDSVFVSRCKRCEREEQKNKSIKGSIRESSISSRSHITLPNQMGVRQSLQAHTHRYAHTHAGSNAKTKEIISPQHICSVCTPPVSFSADVIMSSSALQTNTDVMIARYRQDKWTRRGVALEIGLFHFILLKFWCGAKPKYLTGKRDEEKERCDLRSLSTVINWR